MFILEVTKKRIWAGILIVLVLIVGVSYFALQMKLNSLEESLKSYLLNEGGYSDSDILSIHAKLSSMPKYPVFVRFADDPDTDYIFTDRDASEWTQLDPKDPQRIIP
ncbi:DUF3139 domain-containing protein [Paenibacillus enshidis]|uniref:DUF3139 domain-containing protein n=1 Tax=Paenibacillus enshidis TaxID=1458439 RepID=A0ABV5B0X3_9BACL